MFESIVYVNRRRALLQQMEAREAHGVAVFLGNVDAATNYRGNDYKFRQNILADFLLCAPACCIKQVKCSSI